MGELTKITKMRGTAKGIKAGDQVVEGEKSYRVVRVEEGEEAGQWTTVTLFVEPI